MTFLLSILKAFAGARPATPVGAAPRASIVYCGDQLCHCRKGPV